MNFLDLVFLPFILIFMAVYFLTPRKYRYIVIFIGSCVFYGYHDPKTLLILLLATVISYLGGAAIQRSRRKKACFVVFFALEILLLVVYKYSGFIISNVNWLAGGIGRRLGRTFPQLPVPKLLLPVGLSFIVFQACTYLSDVYRNHFPAERNLIRYGAFVAFFPTVLSGPIQKARSLLPQIKNPSRFDFEQAQKGLLLLAWGILEKILVANSLMKIYTIIIENYPDRSSAEMLIGAICFSLYIYADFSSYSDMARGLGKLLGIDVGKNFNTPYLAASTSEFWKRWHMSLNSWLTENVYIPLGGNRKGIFRKCLNVMAVFAISGLWHGADWNFLVWGLLNGLLVVLGQLLKPCRDGLCRLIRLDRETESILFIRRAFVCFLITLTWTFFNNPVEDAQAICLKLLQFDFVSLFNPALLEIAGSHLDTFIAVLTAAVFCRVQYSRRREAEAYARYRRQPLIIQCLLLAALICACLFGLCATEANVNTQFIYFRF